jgi:hypothetical protein
MVTAPIETAPYSEAARILHPEDCALAVIDIQEKLLAQICASAKKQLTLNAGERASC